MAGTRASSRTGHGSPVAWIALAPPVLAACMGSVDRVYDDGGAPSGVDSSIDGRAAGGGLEAGESGSGSGSGGVDATTDATTDGATDATSDATKDAASDAAAGNDVQAESGHPPDAASDAATGQTYACGGQQVTSCAGCASGTVDCVFCGQAGSHPGVCGSKSQLCSQSTPAQSTTCNCQNDGDCPAPFQVCTPFGPQSYCQTCGENGSDGKTCKGGGTCNASSGQCG